MEIDRRDGNRRSAKKSKTSSAKKSFKNYGDITDYASRDRLSEVQMLIHQGIERGRLPADSILGSFVLSELIRFLTPDGLSRDDDQIFELAKWLAHLIQTRDDLRHRNRNLRDIQSSVSRQYGFDIADFISQLDQKRLELELENKINETFKWQNSCSIGRVPRADIFQQNIWRQQLVNEQRLNDQIGSADPLLNYRRTRPDRIGRDPGSASAF